MKDNLVLDETLRYLYCCIRNKGAHLLAIRFIHRGKKWEADSPEEAVRLRRELEGWDEVDAEEGKGISPQEIRAESVWTPDTFWEFCQQDWIVSKESCNYTARRPKVL